MKISELTLLLFICFAVFTNVAEAQDTNEPEQENTGVQKGKLYLAPLPVVGANPAFGFFYGAAASGSMFLGDPTNTSISNALVTATYSTKEQLMFTLKSTVYSNRNEWMFIGDWRLFFSSQPTYGLGTGPKSHILSNHRKHIHFKLAFRLNVCSEKICSVLGFDISNKPTIIIAISD